MMGYSKLFSEIITSSIWSEDDKTRIVWITMLALKDKDGFVPAALPGLANAARVTVDECATAISKLEAPDKYSRTSENEGRRISKVDGGWIVLNHHKYRDQRNEEERREYQRKLMWNKRHVSNVSTNVSNVSTMLAHTDTYTDTDKIKNLSTGVDGGVVYPPDFIEFWNTYPRKEGKKSALKAWIKAKDKPEIFQIRRKLAIQKHSDQWQKDGGQYIPMPATWLNGGRWMDETINTSQTDDRATVSKFGRKDTL